MADQKTTELTALTTPATDDLLYIVDDVAGTPTSKKITYANLVLNVGNTFTKTQTITPSPAADSLYLTGSVGIGTTDPNNQDAFVFGGTAVHLRDDTAATFMASTNGGFCGFGLLDLAAGTDAKYFELGSHGGLGLVTLVSADSTSYDVLNTLFCGIPTGEMGFFNTVPVPDAVYRMQIGGGIKTTGKLKVEGGSYLEGPYYAGQAFYYGQTSTGSTGNVMHHSVGIAITGYQYAHYYNVPSTMSSILELYNSSTSSTGNSILVASLNNATGNAGVLAWSQSAGKGFTFGYAGTADRFEISDEVALGTPYLSISFASGVPANSVATVYGQLALKASTTGLSSLNIPSGTAPTSPVDGDVWSDGTDLLVRLGGTTYTLTKV